MKKVKCILFLLLSCGVLTCGSGKANVKNTDTNWASSKEEKELKEDRAKAKILFPDMVDYEQISSKYFEKDKDDYLFLMRFSSIICGPAGKLIRVPIFRGTMGDVLYVDFLEYCETKGLLEKGVAESGFYVEFEKGEYNKVLDEFKEFYGSRLSIDFKKDPARWIPYLEGYGKIIDGKMIYAFTLDGVDWELSFHYLYDEKYRNEATRLYYAINLVNT